MKKTLLALLPLIAIVSCEKAEKGPEIHKPSIEANQRKVADWMLDNRETTPGGRQADNEWTVAAWYTGLFSLYEQTNNPHYLEHLMAMENTVNWKVGKRRFFGDDQAIGQVYLDLYRNVNNDPAIIADFKAVVDEQIAMPDPGLGLHTAELYEKGAWSWCDSVFMAPPGWARLSLVTGNQKYLDAMDEKFWKTYDFLYDKEEKLFYRDASYFDKLESNGKKIFWSRGNGWVMGGLARVLDVMPSDYPTRHEYESLFKEMAGRIRDLQQPDGLWRASLLDPGSYPNGETSGTAFYTYALAWGINQGLLDAKTYAPCVSRAWTALNRCIDADGKLGWAQPIGQDPKQVKAEDTEVYAVGAYLLAGREILALDF